MIWKLKNNNSNNNNSNNNNNNNNNSNNNNNNFFNISTLKWNPSIMSITSLSQMCI